MATRYGKAVVKTSGPIRKPLPSRSTRGLTGPGGIQRPPLPPGKRVGSSTPSDSNMVKPLRRFAKGTAKGKK